MLTQLCGDLGAFVNWGVRGDDCNLSEGVLTTTEQRHCYLETQTSNRQLVAFNHHGHGESVVGHDLWGS